MSNKNKMKKTCQFFRFWLIFLFFISWTEKAEKAEPDEFDIYRNNSAEKKYIFAVTLAEINRKLGNGWNGPRTNGPKLNGPEEATSSTVSR